MDDTGSPPPSLSERFSFPSPRLIHTKWHKPFLAKHEPPYCMIWDPDCAACRAYGKPFRIEYTQPLPDLSSFAPTIIYNSCSLPVRGKFTYWRDRRPEDRAWSVVCEHGGEDEWSGEGDLKTLWWWDFGRGMEGGSFEEVGSERDMKSVAGIETAGNNLRDQAVRNSEQNTTSCNQGREKLPDSVELTNLGKEPWRSDMESDPDDGDREGIGDGEGIDDQAWIDLFSSVRGLNEQCLEDGNSGKVEESTENEKRVYVLREQLIKARRFRVAVTSGRSNSSALERSRENSAVCPSGLDGEEKSDHRGG